MYPPYMYRSRLFYLPEADQLESHLGYPPACHQRRKIGATKTQYLETLTPPSVVQTYKQKPLHTYVFELTLGGWGV
jgi:hypothetical protein